MFITSSYQTSRSRHHRAISLPGVITILGLLLVQTLIAATPVTLRGFGTVTVASQYFGEGTARSSWITFQAQDAEHAQIIGSKLMSDLLGFGDIKTVEKANAGGITLELKGSGIWRIGVEKSNCHVLFARSPGELSTLAGKADAAAWQSPATRAYPRWLDCFDNAATGIWWGGGGSAVDIPGDFEWAKERKFTLAAPLPSFQRFVQPGLIDTSIIDWFAAMMQRYDTPFRTYLWPYVSAASWNYEPLPAVKHAPMFKIGSSSMNWEASYRCGQIIPTGGTEPVAAWDPFMHDFQRRFAAGLNDDPNFVGNFAVSEMNGAGVLDLAVVAGLPETKTLWHEYLKKNLGPDLKKIGSMHKGRADAYRSWDDVQVPAPQDFVGFNATSLDLTGTWQGHADVEKAGTKAQWYQPSGAPAGGWQPVDCNDAMLMMYNGGKRTATGREKIPDYWLRRSFTVTPAQVAQFKYLHISRNKSYPNTPMTPLFDVYINGQPLAKFNRDRSDAKFEQCLDVGGNIKPGENQIVVNTLGNPVPGYLFLGATPLRDYPYMTEPENRLWFDTIQFDTSLRMRGVENTLRAMRQGDPNRPLKLCAMIDLQDAVTELCEKYGAYNHNTGGASGTWIPMFGARHGVTHGLPFSCEPGNEPHNATDLQSIMTHYLMYGNHAVDILWMSAFRKETAPDTAAWLDQNLELMHAIGKLDMPLPPIAILRSCRAIRLGFSEPWVWDLGRGALQGTGRNFAYVEIPDITNGFIDKFPVVIDDGTVLMTAEDVEGIKRYIQNGGIFIAQHHTGRHLPERADAWPLAAAFGLKVTPKYVTASPVQGDWPVAKIKFSESQELFPSLRGKQCSGRGVCIDFMNNQYTGAVGLSGRKDVAVANWVDDGSMAVANIPLGKGRLIYLGTPFFYGLTDVAGKWINRDDLQGIIDEFLTAVGVPRDSWTGSQEFWAERWLSKNGVYDLYPVARMTKDPKLDAVRNATISIRRATPPADVIEISANGHPKVNVKWQTDRFTLPAADYTLMQSRLFAAPRPDLEDAALRWFDVQRRIWRGLTPVPPPTKEEIKTVPENVLPIMEGWKAVASAGSDTAWQQPGFNDTPWKAVKLGSFAAMGLPDTGIARMRKEITLPESWKGRSVMLVFDAESRAWGVIAKAQLWINGEPAPVKQLEVLGQDNSFFLDISGQARNGKITLALEVDGNLPEAKKKGGKPAGVLGIFYLQSAGQPVAVTKLSGPWQAARDIGVFTPVETGKKAEYTYLEKRFTLPKSWPARRVYLESPVHLGWVILNNSVLSTPGSMHSLDISGLVVKNGENVLRWLPATDGAPSFNRVTKSPAVPEASLVWRN